MIEPFVVVSLSSLPRSKRKRSGEGRRSIITPFVRASCEDIGFHFFFLPVSIVVQLLSTRVIVADAVTNGSIMVSHSIFKGSLFCRGSDITVSPISAALDRLL